MENLKNWVRTHFTFDERYTFEENLNSNLDNTMIYYKDCKDFYNINPALVIKLAKELMDIPEMYEGKNEFEIIVASARNGLGCLVYNYMYGELERLYNEQKGE